MVITINMNTGEVTENTLKKQIDTHMASESNADNYDFLEPNLRVIESESCTTPKIIPEHFTTLNIDNFLSQMD